MVPEQGAEELLRRVHAGTGDLEPDRPVGVLEIRRDGPSATVDPASHDAVAQEAVVGLVGVAQEHARRQLAVNGAVRADGRAAEVAPEHARIGADPERTLETGPGADLHSTL